MDLFEGTDPISIQLAVDSLVARYADYCDTQDWPALVGLFEPDGVFDTGEVFGQVMTGHEELERFFRALAKPKAHHATSVYITEISSEQVRSRMKMITFYTRWLFSIDYEWTLTRSHGPWRIATQKISQVAKVPLGADTTAIAGNVSSVS
jgi:3-phenylpropionate/cinnamic acid dioxygenase small subunit